jgi:polyisoprenoid-binding protein YceI
MSRRTHRHIPAALLGLLIAAWAWPAAGAEPTAPQWSVVMEDSRLGFTAFQSGSPVTGRFDSFKPHIHFDPDDLPGSRVEVEIDMASVNTDSADRDSTIRSQPLFHVEEYPTARFEAGAFRHRGGDEYAAEASLTMRGVTREIVLPFTLEVAAHPDKDGWKTATAKAEIEVDRLDYGIGQGQWQDTSVVANRVVISFEIRAERPMP